MTDYTKIIKTILRDFHDLAEGKVKGYTSGLEEVDKMVGRMDKGQLWTIGGYTGTGKSFFIFNMIEGMLEKENAPKVIVFSTELDNIQYVKRHLFMRAGLWKVEFDSSPKSHIKEMEKISQSYLEERIFSPESLNIEGDIFSLEQIDESLREFDEETSPVVVFIDYVQELSVNGKYDEKDTMPEIALRLKNMAKQHNCIIIAISQVNQGDAKTDMSSTQRMPFSYGKQLNQASHVQIVLNRKREGGELLKVLEVTILKARDGLTGTLNYEILKGYNLSFTSQDHAAAIKKEAQNRGTSEKSKDFFGGV